jgi:hypothetical protein
MAEMNKSHFATMLEELKEDHTAALGAHTTQTAEQLKALRMERDSVLERISTDLEAAKAELEVSHSQESR